METSVNSKTVSLVLGSGGARGMAHIGVIHYLLDHGYHIGSISGCSIGSLIGGVYALGKLDVFESWLRQIKKSDIASLLDFSWSMSGLFKGDKVINTMVELIGDTRIEDLPIDFTAVAADIHNEKEVWINKGQLFDAIRASISLPLFFTPFVHNGIELVDGGVLNPVPIAPAFSDNNDLIIAVNLGAEKKQSVDSQDNVVIDEKESGFLREKIWELTNSVKNKDKLNITRSHYLDIADKSFDTMQSALARTKLAAYPPDFTIDIARNACGTLDFDLADHMISLGYEKAKDVLG